MFSYHHTWAAIFALTSALLWAFVSILFKKLGDDVSPIGMNLGKSVIASFFLGILFLFYDRTPISNNAVIFLGISGLLGISLGDTFYFQSLVRLGPRLSLIITTLIPVVTILLVHIMLHESLLPISWLGIFFTLSGVFLVLWDGAPVACYPIEWKSGIIYGVLTVLCCAAAVIFSKMALNSTSALKATFIRQIFGVLGLIFLGLINFQLKDWLKPLFNGFSLMKKLFFASFVGTFLGTWFCILALKYTDTAIAATLNATGPLFILPLAFFILKEKISSRAIMGSLVAVGGVSLIFLGGV